MAGRNRYSPYQNPRRYPPEGPPSRGPMPRPMPPIPLCWKKNLKCNIMKSAGFWGRIEELLLIMRRREALSLWIRNRQWRRTWFLWHGRLKSFGGTYKYDARSGVLLSFLVTSISVFLKVIAPAFMSWKFERMLCVVCGSYRMNFGNSGGSFPRPYGMHTGVNWYGCYIVQSFTYSHMIITHGAADNGPLYGSSSTPWAELEKSRMIVAKCGWFLFKWKSHFFSLLSWLSHYGVGRSVWFFPVCVYIGNPFV
ncbi:hypothetical protein OSB04_004820 [Centaurea solstitialis]|uniref:Uncharacterized protein n=1 Tax=Centaurea solstitialis TaxID=347529 RepID=A0AA38TRG7_9ASTR|nr:hypothetical protein OSB04_004820 [Centaurea solstitialis]